MGHHFGDDIADAVIRWAQGDGLAP